MEMYNYIKCNLAATNILYREYHRVFIHCTDDGNIFFILLMAPVETESKKISQDERQHYKRKIKFFIGIHLMIMVMLIRWGVKEYIFSMMFVYFVQNMMLLMEMVKKSKWVLKNE